MTSKIKQGPVIKRWYVLQIDPYIDFEYLNDMLESQLEIRIELGERFAKTGTKYTDMFWVAEDESKLPTEHEFKKVCRALLDLTEATEIYKKRISKTEPVV